MNRLGTIISLIEPCDIFADIGTDHGLIARAALSSSKKVVASDISDKCLQKAKELLKANKNIEFLVSDGLKNFTQNPDLISICGMGGHTIIDILSDYFIKNKTAKLILQPQTYAHMLREFLMRNNYSIKHDILAKEKKKFYTIIKAVPNTDKLDSSQILFGKFYKEKCPLLKEKLQLDIARLQNYNAMQYQDLIQKTKEALIWQE